MRQEVGIIFELYVVSPGPTTSGNFVFVFLGARAPLEIPRVKKNNNRIRKKFQIAITCSLLLLLAP